VLRALQGLCADGLAAFLPRPYVLCGRSGAGKAEAVEAMLACSGCLFAFARVSSLDTVPGLFGALVRGVARGLAGRVLRGGGGGGAGAARAAADAFMARVCHPSRGRAGWAAGAALAAWGDTSAGTLRRAYERALLGQYRGGGGGGGGGGAGGCAWEAPGGAARPELLTRALVQSTIPPARADTVAELAGALRALGALTLGDVCLGEPAAVLRAAGLAALAEAAGSGGGSDAATAVAAAAAAAAEWPVAPWLVVEGADVLGAEQPALLASLLSLRAGGSGGGGAGRVSVLLLGDSGVALSDALRPAAGRNRAAAPTFLAWAGPSRERVLGALRAGAPPGAPPALYAEFVKRLALALGGVLDWDVAEWRHAAEALWPPFFAPTRGGRVSEADAQGLYAAAAPAFLAFKQRLLNHEVGGGARGSGGGGSSSGAPAPAPPLSAALPRMSRLLLVAAFAASHTPPGQDVRYFSRAASGKRRAAAVARARAAGGGGAGAAGAIPMADGPHPFSLERLLSVAHAFLAALDGVKASYAMAHNELYLGGVAALLGARLLLVAEGEERGGGVLGAARRAQRLLVANISAEEAHALAATLAPQGQPPFSLLPYLHDPTVT
jgi:hypothetical protein